MIAQISPLNIWMISFDPPLASMPEGDARSRHMEYASLAGRLTVITASPAGLPPEVRASNALTILPTNTRSALRFVPAALATAGRLTGKPDLIVTQDMFLTGLVGRRLKQRFKAPLLVQEHSFILNNPAWMAEHPLRNRALVMMAHQVLRGADYVRAVASPSRANLQVLGFPETRIAILPLATASTEFAKPVDPGILAKHRARAGIPEDVPVVLWVGRPVLSKRIPLLLKVFGKIAVQVPEAYFLMIGDFRETADSITETAITMGIADKLKMYGPIPLESLPPYYQLANVYLLSSSYEGVPRVLGEAASAGLPVVATGAGGITDILLDSETGFYALDDANVAQNLANHAVTLLRDPDLAKRMGQAGQRHALTNFNAEGYPERWVNIWRQAIKAGIR